MKNIAHILIIALITGLITLNSTTVQATETEGVWRQHTVLTTGSWEINDDQIILRNFETGDSPDLKLILSPHKVGQLESRNAMHRAIVVTPIKETKGTFAFQLPDGLDLGLYQSIGIHCGRHTKLFAKSAI